MGPNCSVALGKYFVDHLLCLCLLGDYLEKMIPLIIQYCNVEDDELREYCFQAFESFVRRFVPFIQVLYAADLASMFFCSNL